MLRTQRRKTEEQVWRTQVCDGGMVCVPPWVGTEWRLGQRVYLQASPGRVLITPRLKRTANGRVHSTRVHRCPCRLRPKVSRIGWIG